MHDKSEPWILGSAVLANLAIAGYAFCWNPVASQNPYLVGYAFSVVLGIILSWLCWALI